MGHLKTNSLSTKIAVACAATFFAFGLNAYAHIDSRGMTHQHINPEEVTTDIFYNNGAHYLAINNSRDVNGSLACNAEGECSWCTGDEATEQSHADCQTILKGAQESGEKPPTSGSPESPGNKPGAGNKPGKGKGKGKKNKQTSSRSAGYILFQRPNESIFIASGEGDD